MREIGYIVRNVVNLAIVLIASFKIVGVISYPPIIGFVLLILAIIILVITLVARR